MNTHLKTNKITSVLTPLLLAIVPAATLIRLTFKIEQPMVDETPTDGP